MIKLKNILNESSNTIKQYYHGTDKESHGLSILNDGYIKSGMIERRGWMKPQSGRIYLTPNLEYSVIYTIGGNMIGQELPKKWIDENRYGYLFVVKENNININDIIPDEDFIGECVYNKTFQWLNDKCQRIFSKQMYGKAMDGEVMYQIRIGNVLLGKTHRLSNYELQQILNLGCAISVPSPVKIDACYKFDKTLNNKLNKDGSNFFEYAEKIL